MGGGSRPHRLELHLTGKQQEFWAAGCRLPWSLPQQRPILFGDPSLDEVTAGLVLPQKINSRPGQRLFTPFLEPTRRPAQAWAFPPGLSPLRPTPGTGAGLAGVPPPSPPLGGQREPFPRAAEAELLGLSHGQVTGHQGAAKPRPCAPSPLEVRAPFPPPRQRQGRVVLGLTPLRRCAPGPAPGKTQGALCPVGSVQDPGWAQDRAISPL